MTADIATNYESKKRETHCVDTRDVRVNRERSGRVSPATPEEVADLAASIDVFGQLQPVEVVKDSAGNMTLVSGFTRFDAVELLNEQKNTNNTNRVLLWVAVKSTKQLNPEDQYVRNIIENKHRRDTTPLDDAHNQQKLRQDYGWTDARIAALYRVTPSRVSQQRRLLSLIEPIRKLVIAKRLSCAAAEELGTLSVEDQQKWFDAFTNTGHVEKANTEEIREQVRESRASEDDGPKKLTVKGIQKWLASVVNSEDSPDLFKDYCVTFGQFVAGEADESNVWHCVDAMLGVEKKKRKAG